ncbi:MAG: GNAT family N-acetyltransferase [Myxococcota bacterium]
MWLPRPRPAQIEDGPSCIPLLVEAGGDLLRWSVGEGGVELSTALLHRCWHSGGHPLGPKNTRVIEHEGRIVAAITADHTTRWKRAEARVSVPSAGLASPHALAAMGARLGLQTKARPPLRDCDWYVSSIGVAPSHRRRGLARVLLIDATSTARSLRLDAVMVEVVDSNAGAVCLYRAMGFVEDLHWQPTSGPGVVRLRRPIGR